MADQRKVDPSRQPRAVDIALYSVPTLAIVAAAVLLFAGVSPRVVGAQIHGGPPRADGVLSLRFSVLENAQGSFVPLSRINLALNANLASPPSLSGVTDSDGAWETRLALGSSPPASISLVLVANGIENVIPHAEIPTHPPSFAQSQHLVEPALAGSTSGNLSFSLRLARSIIAAPFDETLLLHVSHNSGAPVAHAKVAIDGDVLVRSPEPLVLDAQGDLRLVLRPLLHAAQLNLSVSTDASNAPVGTFSTVLPVQAGALWLDPVALRQKSISVLSPVQHRAAYVTIFDQHSRLFATRLALLPDQHGGSQGALALPDALPDPSWILVSPDPPGHERDVLAWPLSSADAAPARSLRTPLLYDGMPAALAKARARLLLARRASTIVLALAAFVESVLLWSKARRAKRELETLLSSQADLGEAMVNVIAGGHRFWLRMVGACLLVAVALSAVALVAWIGPP